MPSLSSLNDQFTIYPTVNGVWPVPGAFSVNGADFAASDSQPGEPQDGSCTREEAIEGDYEDSPQPVAREALAKKMNGVPPTATGPSRGYLLPVDSEDNKTRVKVRLLEKGANVEAVNECDEIFKDRVSKEALQKRLTRDQCERLGLRDGKQFQRFLEKVEVTGETKNRCRLCPENDAKLYNKPRDALRHFFKDHFGLWFECAYW